MTTKLKTRKLKVLKASSDMWYDKQGKPLRDYSKIESLLKDIKYKRVGYTELEKGVKVSTVWLGLNHNWRNGELLIFETMVFGGKHDGDMDRYTTEKQAIAGHKRMVKKIK